MVDLYWGEGHENDDNEEVKNKSDDENEQEEVENDKRGTRNRRGIQPPSWLNDYVTGKDST